MELQAVRNTEDVTAVLKERYPNIDIVSVREGLIEAHVPVEYIYTEDVPVEEGHVKELASSIKEEELKGDRTGQLIPVLLADVNEFEKLPIMDGFHRVAATAELGKETVYAVIRLDSTWDDVIDLRILSANMHRAVRFARVIEWVEASWARTPWSSKLTAAQAFSAGINKPQTRRELTHDETTEVKEWVKTKCEQWRLTASAVYNFLSIASVADPELVNETRERKGGDTLEALTPAHLGVIAKGMPLKYDFQRLIAATAKEYNLTVPLTRNLVEKLINVDTAEEAAELINPAFIDSLEPSLLPTRKGNHQGSRAGVSRYTVHGDPELLKMLFIDELEIAKLSLENLILQGKYIAPPHATQSKPSTMLTSEQRDLALQKIGLGDASVWSTEQIGLAANYMDTLAQSFAGRLLNMGFSERDIKDIEDTVKYRLLADIKSGGLRFEEIDDPKRIASLYLACLRDETAIRRNPQESNVRPLLPPQEISVEKIVGRMGSLDRMRRRATVLNFIFNLHPKTIAQVLDVAESEIEILLPLLSKNFRSLASAEKVDQQLESEYL